MKQFAFIITILLIIVLPSGAQNQVDTERLILKLKNENKVGGRNLCRPGMTGNARIDSLNRVYQALKIEKQSTGKKTKQFIYLIEFPAGTDIKKVIEAYYKTGEIEYAEPDHQGSGAGVQVTVPDDQYYFRQWGLKNDGSFSLSNAKAGADIEMEKAWDLEQGDSNIVVAIIDTGAKTDHPEFAGRIWKNVAEIPGNGIDDDNNGYIDDVIGWNFVVNDNDPADDYGHGTNVTGIIGANANNTAGYAGVDWHCRLMILKGLDNNNNGFYSWWASAIYYAVDNGAHVINLSLGGMSTSTTLQNAVSYAINNNVVVVACMMNVNSNTVFYPAGFQGVIAVGASSANDTRSVPFFWSSTSGSNYGSHISVVAPGNYIYGLHYLSSTNYNSYWSGTSQAAPHVAGLAALLLAQEPGRTPAQVKSIIESTAEDQVGNPIEDISGWDQYYGHGRINAFRALALTTNISSPVLHEQEVSLFPNPANGDFTARFPENTEQIKIFNALGESLQTMYVTGKTSEHFRLEKDGTYFIIFSSGKKTISRKLVVSQ